MSTLPPEQLYETDFYAWTQAQAKELRRFARARPNLPLDLEHLAEEIRDLGKSERDAVFSRAQQILQHFLLIEHSPAVGQRPHRMDEIDDFRVRMKRKLSPAIRRHLKRELPELYADGRRIVARKMRRHGEDDAATTLPDRMSLHARSGAGDWEPDGVAARR